MYEKGQYLVHIVTIAQRTAHRKMLVKLLNTVPHTHTKSEKERENANESFGRGACSIPHVSVQKRPWCGKAEKPNGKRRKC